MVLENLKVKHKTFGDGVVVSAQGKYMTIRFSTCEKNFVYPDSFEKFLTLEDGTVSDEILADLSTTNEIKRSIQAKKEEEIIYSMKHGIVIPGRFTPENSEGSDEDESSYKNSEEV